MIQLVFNPERLSRKTTRDEWKLLWRWKRETQKKFEEVLTTEVASLANVTDPDIKAAMLDRIVNPPIMIVPDFNMEK